MKITNANQLISGKYYLLKNADQAIKAKFVEEKPIKPCFGCWVPQNLPLSYFMNVTICGRSLTATTKKDLLEQCKNYDIEIYEYIEGVSREREISNETN